MSSNEELLRLIQDLTQQIEIIKEEMAELKCFISNNFKEKIDLEEQNRKYLIKYPRGFIDWSEW